MEKENYIQNKYVKDALRNFIPALELMQVLAKKIEPVEDLIWFKVWKETKLQSTYKALFGPR